MKRGQVSVFVIIALVVVGLVGGFFVIRGLDYGGGSFDSQVDDVYEGMMECFEEVHKGVISKVAIQGGYYSTPYSSFIDYGPISVPYYYFDGGINYIPSVEIMEEELYIGSTVELLECFNILENYELEFDFDYVVSNVSIGEEDIVFVNDVRLTLSKEDQSESIDFNDYPISINSNLLEMNRYATYVALSHDFNEGKLCLSCFLDISLNDEFILDISTKEDYLLMEVIDNRTEYYPQSYRFLLSSRGLNKFQSNLMVFDGEFVSSDEYLNLNVSEFGVENE